MGPDRGIGNAERRGHFGNAAHFDNGKQHALGVSLNALPMTSERDDIVRAALRTNKAATAV